MFTLNAVTPNRINECEINEFTDSILCSLIVKNIKPGKPAKCVLDSEESVKLFLEIRPPVIICHGLLETRRSWRGVAKTIRNLTKRSVVIVDLRNHGASPHSTSQRYEHQASDVLQLMKKLDIKRACLMGHNVGARTAMCASLLAPASVAGLLVVDMSPVSTSPDFIEYYPRLMEEMGKVVWNEKKKVHKAQRAIKKQLKNVIKDDVTMKAVLNNINVKPDGTIGWTCNLDVLKKQFKNLCYFPRSLKGKKYDGPTLFIGGQMSEHLPPDDLPGIREMFPRAVIKYIARTGHNVHADDPKAFMELAIKFLRTI